MHFQLEMVTRETVVIRLFGELDHHAVEQIRAKISTAIFQGTVTTIIWNLEGLSFMDSSGVGLVLGRMRELEAVAGRTILLNPSPTMRKVFQFSGLGPWMMDATEEEAIDRVRGIVNG
ncbi:MULTISPECIES: anti-sigma F factor antagonist [Lysinibacillus]|uniref:anti-sigma F factor antagonist n=1 Tax=Lysinibacillus TaxID=400634 RepID=UPI00201140BA|nr:MULTISPECIES: anti-sigma F factor antagonist [Lysinibacillus]MCL1698119.1 anti-sigma F factor antagonist [Lysinibacillus sp. BPa_S21]MEB2302288.1 anti-sigma F factor antagonist [Lysinibacillus xylanilyticus]